MIESTHQYLQLDSLEWIFVWIALFFLLCGLFSVITIFVSRIIKSYYHKREAILKAQLTPILNSVIVNESLSDVSMPGAALNYYVEELGKIAGDSSFGKEILIQQLLSSKKNLTGRSAATLALVYQKLGLHQLSLRKLRSLQWNVKAKGIRELAEMKWVSSVPHIFRYLKSRNQTLREESVMALVRLEENNPLFFLDEYRAPLTSWMRLNILHHLQKIDQRKLPMFSRWFQHTNKSVVLFCLSMTKQFRQREAIPQLMQLLQSSDHDIIAQVVDTLGELDAYEQADTVAGYGDTYRTIKAITVQVARCLAKIGDQSHVPFLLSLLDHPEHQVRFEALKALKKLDEPAILKLTVLPGSSLMKTIKHLEEPLLQ